MISQIVSLILLHSTDSCNSFYHPQPIVTSLWYHHDRCSYDIGLKDGVFAISDSDIALPFIADCNLAFGTGDMSIYVSGEKLHQHLAYHCMYKDAGHIHRSDICLGRVSWKFCALRAAHNIRTAAGSLKAKIQYALSTHTCCNDCDDGLYVFKDLGRLHKGPLRKLSKTNVLQSVTASRENLTRNAAEGRTKQSPDVWAFNQERNTELHRCKRSS